MLIVGMVMSKIWYETQELVRSRSKVLRAGGELLSQLFATQEHERGVPPGGYRRRPHIGLRLELPGGNVLTCKPGFHRGAGELTLSEVHLELLGPGKLLRLKVKEDGVDLQGFVAGDMTVNAARCQIICQALYDLLHAPTKTFARQRDRCCCCGKGLTDITSRLRGIGPECIKSFPDVEAIAAEVRAKPEYRGLDAEWRCSADLEVAMQP